MLHKILSTLRAEALLSSLRQANVSMCCQGQPLGHQLGHVLNKPHAAFPVDQLALPQTDIQVSRDNWVLSINTWHWGRVPYPHAEKQLKVCVLKTAGGLVDGVGGRGASGARRTQVLGNSRTPVHQVKNAFSLCIHVVLSL